MKISDIVRDRQAHMEKFFNMHKAELALNSRISPSEAAVLYGAVTENVLKKYIMGIIDSPVSAKKIMLKIFKAVFVEGKNK